MSLCCLPRLCRGVAANSLGGLDLRRRPFRTATGDKPAKQVARETGARYGGVLYVDSLTEADGPVPTFLDLLQFNADTIVNGFLQSE